MVSINHPMFVVVHTCQIFIKLWPDQLADVTSQTFEMAYHFDMYLGKVACSYILFCMV